MDYKIEFYEETYLKYDKDEGEDSSELSILDFCGLK